MENINSWKDIKWVAVKKHVFRLQLRIYKAALNKEFDKMYKLQKMLSSSKFAKYLAVRKVTQDNAGKKTPGVDHILINSHKDKFDLANSLTLDGSSSPIKRTYIVYSDGKQRPLEIPMIKDRAKQMLAYLALCPQWESQFEANSYGFRPGRSVQDAIEAVFLGISKKPKWVLDADISKCFDEINHQYLLDKCNTYPEMRKQISAWLKAGILYGGEYSFPEMGTSQGGIISPLLANIVLHGLREHLDLYINTLGEHRPNNRQSLTYVRYADDFVLMYPDREILLNLKGVVEEFLEPIGLELHPIKTRLVHTLNAVNDIPPGFTFLGFDVIQRQKRTRQRVVFTKRKSKQDFVTLITPSRKGVRAHRLKLREIIRKYRGVDQENLIKILNPIIRGWALSKRSQIASKIFQDLDAYVWTHLWKWCRKRHPKMSKVKLKEKYWHTVGKQNWVFGVKNYKNGNVDIRLQLHSKIPIKRHVKVKGTASPFDGNIIYWAQRTGKSPILTGYKAKLVREQKGRCGLCEEVFLPDDIIERDHIIPKFLGGKNRRNNVHAVHHYCHLEKTNKERLKFQREKNK